MGENKGLLRPFILSYSEKWLQYILGNRIQLCCRCCACVCLLVWTCAGMRVFVCVCSCLCAVAPCVRVDLFCVILTAKTLFYPQPPCTNIWEYTAWHEVCTVEHSHVFTFNCEFIQQREHRVRCGYPVNIMQKISNRHADMHRFSSSSFLTSSPQVSFFLPFLLSFLWKAESVSECRRCLWSGFELYNINDKD